MGIKINGWIDNNNNTRIRIVRDVIEIMNKFLNNTLLSQELQICNIKSINCHCADENPCTHYDRSIICLNVEGAYWCQFVHQLSHELCHCSTSRKQLPQKIKWFDEFICCCSSFLVELHFATSQTDNYNYMFSRQANKIFEDFINIKQEGHIYLVENTKQFFSANRSVYELDENLIKKHDVFVRTYFDLLSSEISGLSFVGKMHLINTDNECNIEMFLSKLLAICNEKEKHAIENIYILFGIAH